MDYADMTIGKSSPVRISATQLQAQYGSFIPRNIRFTCPYCNQPVRPCAMGTYNFQSPHFRHKQNNEIAQQCELYASGLGNPSPISYYQRAPLPMFIHRLSGSPDHFVVEGGFKAINHETLSRLTQDNARLKMGSKQYIINERRFSSGLTRIPFEDISLTPSSNCQLINTSIPFEDAWNPPEDAARALVFTCEQETFQGKRLRTGETIAAGSYLLLLAPDREEKSIGNAFDKARRVGFAGPIIGTAKLQVFHVKLAATGPLLEKGRHYLASCGIVVGEPVVKPELLWPPALMSDDDIRPLFPNSSRIFGVSANGGIGHAYYCTNPSFFSAAISAPLTPSEGRDYGLVALASSSTVCLLMSNLVSAEGSVLVDTSCPDLLDALPSRTEDFRLSYDSDKRLVVEASSPVSVIVLQRGRASQRIDLNGESKRFERVITSREIVKVIKRLADSAWALPLWAHLPSTRLHNQQDKAEESSTRERLLALLQPQDIQLAKHRAKGLSHSQSATNSKELALTRSVSR